MNVGSREKFIAVLRSRAVGEALRFVVVGVLSTAIHYGIYCLLLGLLSLNVAYSVGFVAGFAFNYVATNLFTFRTLPSWRNLLGLMGVQGVNYLIHLLLLNVFVAMGLPEHVAPLAVYAIAIPVTFVLARWVFRT